ncbi:carboxymuconolactone decarboxylase family protein [Nonomuraea sp. NBC_01738]|uniref:carboxymuconolactone decarboxylase family protein n=1 Tax=Nonomuraea sp. NBC_01738 TaxID=2976003 RepID=UPI002E119644|nr:carboxymuconolactone decarboxylase family protein [Nonomuraea sp. NBC_01738]
MQARTNFYKNSPKAYEALLAIEKFLNSSALPKPLLELVKIRSSQINGCGFCLDMHNRDAKKAGERDERLWGVAAWRESPYFSDQERAALALTEAMCRIADNPNGVPDDVWNDAAGHFDEETLSVLIMAVAQINTWNRINVTVRQPAPLG